MIDLKGCMFSPKNRPVYFLPNDWSKPYVRLITNDLDRDPISYDILDPTQSMVIFTPKDYGDFIEEHFMPLYAFQEMLKEGKMLEKSQREALFALNEENRRPHGHRLRFTQPLHCGFYLYQRDAPQVFALNYTFDRAGGDGGRLVVMDPFGINNFLRREVYEKIRERQSKGARLPSAHNLERRIACGELLSHGQRQALEASARGPKA